MDQAELLGTQLDRATATLIASSEGERHFIAETVMTAVALFLLKKYADGYLMGLGFEEAAKRHGEKTKEFLQQLRAGLSDDQTAAAKADLDESLSLMTMRPLDEAAQASASAQVAEAYVEAGAIQAQADLEARKVARVAERIWAS